MTSNILQQDVQNLLEFFAKNLYRARDSESGVAKKAMEKCIEMMKLDYSVIQISNANGELSSHYPSQIIIPEYESKSSLNGSTTQTSPSATTSQPKQDTIYETVYDPQKMKELITKARCARCRARFPIPVILYKGKYVCRSSTLSGGPEIYGRSGLDLIFGVDSSPYDDDDDIDIIDSTAAEACEQSNNEELIKEKTSDWQLFDRVRSQDIKLLKTLNIGTIIDFMVEKKKVKYGVYVTSSEKVDKERRYSDFNIVSLPYPGCEFFRKYRDNNYSGENLIFDWSQSHVDANIGVPDDSITSQLSIDWDDYKTWDLVKITQNYLRLVIKYLHDNSTGLLIHCISGWDRTPLFISLLRLSLWADGVIHQSLSSLQMLYFTIAYDWVLFGHNLQDRLTKREEIFFFCFYVLKYIYTDEFSVLGQKFKSKNSSGGSSSIGVIRTDSECMLDGMLFDGESRGSSLSLSSTCSDKTHPEGHNHNQPVYHDELSSPWLLNHDSNSSIGYLSSDNSNHAPSPPWPSHPNSTSPVSVPESGSTRERLESTSSLSVGSWQMISGTGSLKSSSSSIDRTSPQQNNNISSNSNGGTGHHENTTSQESNGTVIDNEPSTSIDICNLRRERLNGIRSVFYHCYCSTIGFNIINGTETSLGSLLGNFAERVGFSSQRTSV